MGGHRSRSGWLSIALDGWAVLLVAVLCWPMLSSGGYGLARDMVFVPSHGLGWDSIGLGEVPARAVPLDALLGVLSLVLDGAVLFRFCVFGTLLAVGWGAHRLLSGRHWTARALAATLAIWNPYVVERIGMGQWALLVAYAASWWLLPAVRDWVRDGTGRALGVAAAAVLLSSVTPTGGLLALLLVGTVAGSTSRRGSSTGAPRRLVTIVLVGVGAQLPWVLPSLLGTSGLTSDSHGVAAFAARGEGPLGVWASVLRGGGIWNVHVVPASASGVLGVVGTLACLVALVVGLRGARRELPGLLPAAAVALVVALLAHLPGGTSVLEWAMANLPGAGLVRDAQKWLMPFVVLLVLCAGVALDAATRRARTSVPDLAWLLAAVVLLPLMVLPDAGSVTRAALRPVHYPHELGVALDHVARHGDGALVTLPWGSYRSFSWGNDLSAADPVTKWSDNTVVADDRLRLPEMVLDGESRLAAEIGRALGGPPGQLDEELARLGVRWVLTYSGTDSVVPPLPGLRVVKQGKQVSLLEVRGTVTPQGSPSKAASVLVIGVDLAALLSLTVLLVLLALTRLASGPGNTPMTRRSRYREGPQINRPRHRADEGSTATLPPQLREEI